MKTGKPCKQSKQIRIFKRNPEKVMNLWNMNLWHHCTWMNYKVKKTRNPCKWNEQLKILKVGNTVRIMKV
jgi:hypothetical protein